MTKFIPTADIADILGSEIRSCDQQFFSMGKNETAYGKATTISCYQDNKLVKTTLNTLNPDGILVIDAGYSVHTALVGDIIATAAVENKWAGIIVTGAVRDSAILKTLPICIKALGTNPRKSTQTGSGIIDTPVAIGNLVINPGEWIYIDHDGIVAADEVQNTKIQNN